MISLLLGLAACQPSADGALRRADRPSTDPPLDTAADSGPRDTGGADTAQADTGAGSTDTGEGTVSLPAFYAADQLQSPINAAIRDRLVALRAAGSRLDAQVFMKVGDSITVDPNALGCFASTEVNLGDRDDLQGTIDHFLAGEAGSSTPWDRETRAAEIGQTAAWAMEGDPSPVDRELDKLDPAFAVIQYGTNDMHMAESFKAAMDPFVSSMLDLIDHVLEASVVPVLVTIPPRLDDADADTWVSIYNAAIRGMAQGRQVPLVDLELGLRAVDGYGLYPDGVHLEPYPNGACKLGDSGLAYGCNVRNLLVLDGLDRARRAALEGEVLDPDAPGISGAGTAADPIGVHTFPFSDLRDTADATDRRLDRYTGCDSDADLSGAEVVYRFALARETTVRAMVFDRGEVDVDVAFLGETADEDACVERDDAQVRKTLDPGTWHVVVDTRTRDGSPRPGEYLLVIVEG
jgi:hypothetical protein